jgi:hypothetical protein
MADFGIAAQIGRGGMGGGGGVAAPPDPTNRMLQLMQLQQLQQNMMLAREQEGRAAALAPLQRGQIQAATAADAARTAAVNQQTRFYRTQADTADMEFNAKRGVVEYLAKNSANPRNPEALSALAAANPLAHENLVRRFAETDALLKQAEKEGALSLKAKNELAQNSISNMSWTFDAIRNDREFQTLRNSLVKLDPTAADYIPEEYNPESMRRMGLRLEAWKDTKIEKDERGRVYLLNQRTGGRRYLPEPDEPAGATTAPAGGAVTTAPAGGVTAPAGGVTAPAGTPIVQPRATAPEGVGPKAAAAAEKKAAEEAVARQAKEAATAKELDNAITEISAAAAPGGLISKSTGSGIGRAIDAAAAFVGVATPGATAGARLAPIADLALKMVPRFEGPQSDADRLAYERASGQLADTSIPTATRQAAAKEVVRLMQKRRNEFTVQGAGSGQPARAVTRTGTVNGRRVVQYSDGTVEYAD